MSDATKATPNARTPAKLNARARRVWDNVTTKYVLRDDELAVLEDACHELTLCDKIKRKLDAGDLTVKGSMGQEVAHPLIAELRQHRSTAQRLLVSLKLPDEDEARPSQDGRTSSNARKAANARWQRGA